MKYILGALGVIFLVILVVVLIMRGGGGDRRGPATEQVVVSEQAREGVSAVLTTEGAVVGENQRRSIRIIVNQEERRLEILAGYENAVLRAHTYANTPTAFETFLIAIEAAGFDNKKATIVKNYQGACPLGQTYVYQLNEFSQPLIDLWSTSCSGSGGTFNGKGQTIRKLFQKQIPDYNKRVQNVDMTGSKSPEDIEE